MEWGAPRRPYVAECDVCMECVVPAEDTMDMGRERERAGVLGGLGRAGAGDPSRGSEAEDSTEWVISEGEAGRPALKSETTSLEELATLVMLLCGLPPTGMKDGLGGWRFSYGELSAEVASSIAQLLSRVGPRLLEKSGVLRMREVLLPLAAR